MTIILITYIAGVVINALLMAAVHDDLKKEGRLGGVRMTYMVTFTCLSVLTWIFAVCYLVFSLFRKGGGK